MIGELLLAIPGIQFAFTQAPASMKSVITAVWFINNAFGNLIVVLITELKPVEKQVSFYLYFKISSTLLLLIVIIYKINILSLLSVHGVLFVRRTNDGGRDDVHDVCKDI